MLYTPTNFKQLGIWLVSISMLLGLITGCGASSSMTTTNTSTQMQKSMHAAATNHQTQPVFNSTSSSGQQKDIPTQTGPQYLAKTLKVSLNVKDTRDTASIIQTWISTTDAFSSSAGTDYTQTGDNLYNVTLTYSVQATKYSQVYQYLRDYTIHKGGHLTAFNETVRDVTGTYVDTQARIKNLQTEQLRLQDLMNRAQNLSDIVTIDKSLTDVEGQIETYEAQLNTLTSQVAFYTITITLQPIDILNSVPITTNGWSIGQTLHDAFSASVIFAQGLATFLVWLLAFAVYSIPVLIIVWLVRRWRAHPRHGVPHPAETISTPSEHA